MNVHKNAELTARGRAEVVRRVVECCSARGLRADRRVKL